MIPILNILTQEITQIDYPNRTYKINFSENNVGNRQELGLVGNNALSITSDDALSGFMLEDDALTVSYNTTLAGYELTTDTDHALALTIRANIIGKDRISGYIDGVEAIAQAIYLILSTERYKSILYSWDYGVELLDLFGKPIPYVIAEIPRRIKDALVQDNRIEDVVDFQFKRQKHTLFTTFTVVTNIGNITTEMEVEI